MAKNNTAVKPFGMRDKLGYAMGDMGCGFSFQLLSTYMQLFYCQTIGIAVEHYAAIILISKFWDAINDVLIGNLVDTKRIGNKSKFKPWILIGAAALVGLTIMVFAPVGNFPYAAKIVWCLMAYCLWSVAYTMVNVPYGSLLSVITDKMAERTSLSTFRSIGAALPAVIIMIILPNVVYKDTTAATGETVKTLDGGGLFWAAVVLSVVALFTLWGTTKLVTERVQRNDDGANSTGAKAFFSAFKSFFTNRPMVGATIATVASVAFFNSTMSLNNMVFQYFFNDTSKMSIAMIGSYAPMIFVMAFIGKITAKFGKKKSISIAMLISSVAGLAMLLIPIQPTGAGMIIYVVELMFLNVGNSMFQIGVWAVVADCIEISYRKTGKSEEGSLYALYSFFRKLSQGIGQAVSSLGLAAIGFIEGDGAVQAAGFGEKVRMLYFILLFAGSLIAFLSMTFIYNISHKQELEFGNANEEEVEV